MAPVHGFPGGEGIGDLGQASVLKQVHKQPECGAHVAKLSVLINELLACLLLHCLRGWEKGDPGLQNEYISALNEHSF